MDPITIGMLAASALGGIFSNRKKTTEQTQKSTQSIDQTQNPVYSDVDNYVKNFLINRYLDYNQEDDTPFWDAYKVSGLNEYNKAQDTSNDIIDSIITSRGLGTTGAGASALANSAMAGQYKKADFLSSIPGLRDQRRRANLGDFSKFFATLPYGTRTTGTTQSTGTGTNTDPGNMLGGAFAGGAAMLARLYGMGAFDGIGGNNQNIPSFQPIPQPSIGIVPPGYRLPGGR